MSDLQRWGLEWKSEKDFVCTPMEDGYWTPWHIAQKQLEQAEAQNEALRQQLQLFMSAELKTAFDYASSFILRKQADKLEEIARLVKEADDAGLATVASIYEGLVLNLTGLRQQADETERDSD